MARPRETIFYEIPLPQTLPEKEKWLPDYHKYSEMLMCYLVKRGAQSSVYHTAIRCLTELREYLIDTGNFYSDETAARWYENTSPHPKGYKSTLLRLADLFESGNIRPLNAFPKLLPYARILNEPWKEILSGFVESLEMSERSVLSVRNCIAKFLYWLQSRDVSDPTDITYEILEEYYKNDEHISEASDARYTYATGDILIFMADNGMCHHALGWYPYFRMHGRIFRLCDFTEDQKERLEKAKEGSLDFPVEEYAAAIEDFLISFKELGYSDSPCKAASYTLHNLLLFLDMHGFGYHPVIANIWLEHEIYFHKATGWKQARRTLRLFEAYTEDGGIAPGKVFREKPLMYDFLPPWCKEVTDEYMALRNKEGYERSTMYMIRSSVTRFCSFLLDKGIKGFGEITPEVLRDFNIHDPHSTAEGKNAYNIRIRSFIKYLERKGSVPYGMHQALFCISAHSEKIVVTLTDADKEAIKEKHTNSQSPIELRDRAIIMIGTRMGLRASDIVEIRLDDIDWDKQAIHVVQEKTDHEVFLPMPTEVGNAIYTYILRGRPNGRSTSRNLFIKNRTPFDSVGRSACLDALRRTLPERRIPGSGFHVTRKTFATDRLRSGTGRQGIADLLGQRDTKSLSPYLQHDEERMRMCPISLSEAGIQMKGGRYDRV